MKQNPDSPAEMARIVKAGGFVSPPPEPGLSARVWLDAEFTQVGLAMARSIGDHAVKGVGVIAEPEVLVHDFTVSMSKQSKAYLYLMMAQAHFSFGLLCMWRHRIMIASFYSLQMACGSSSQAKKL